RRGCPLVVMLALGLLGRGGVLVAPAAGVALGGGGRRFVVGRLGRGGRLGGDRSGCRHGRGGRRRGRGRLVGNRDRRQRLGVLRHLLAAEPQRDDRDHGGDDDHGHHDDGDPLAAADLADHLFRAHALAGDASAHGGQRGAGGALPQGVLLPVLGRDRAI